MKILTVPAIFASFIPTLGGAVASEAEPALRFLASQNGRSTLDQGEGGGNPFASALVELLGRSELTVGELESEIVRLTEKKSRRFQTPEVHLNRTVGRRQIVPRLTNEKRYALVMVFADYSRSDATSLPGAANDLRRVAFALRRADFEVETVLDPNREQLNLALREFANRSRESEIAILYTTGHGGEDEDGVYLLPGDFGASDDCANANRREIRLAVLEEALQARSVNLLFYGGCRTNPLRRCR